MKLSADAAQTGSFPLLPTSSDFSMKALRAAEVGLDESELAARAALVQAGSRLGWTENWLEKALAAARNAPASLPSEKAWM